MMRPFHIRLIGILSLTSVAFTSAAAVSTTGPKRGSTFIPPLSTNAIPKSIYVIPATAKEGRDPFFPKSDRLAKSAAPKNSGQKSPTLTLIYNGLSGTPERQLAIINGRTLAEGEETELVVGNARVKIRCIEIKGETVIVEAFGERRELHLGAGK